MRMLDCPYCGMGSNLDIQEHAGTARTGLEIFRWTCGSCHRTFEIVCERGPRPNMTPAIVFVVITAPCTCFISLVLIPFVLAMGDSYRQLVISTRMPEFVDSPS